MSKADFKEENVNSENDEAAVSGFTTSTAKFPLRSANGQTQKTSKSAKTSLNRDKPPENLAPDIATKIPSVANMKYIVKNTVHRNTDNQGRAIFKEFVKVGIDNENRQSVAGFLNMETQKIFKAVFDVFLKSILALLYCLFSVYRYFQYNYNSLKFKFFSLIYNPSNSPQLIRNDVSSLAKLPKRLAAILDYKSEEEIGGGVLGLMENSSDVVTWSLSAGIKHLSLYDHDGLLKNDVDLLRKITYNKLCKYFGPTKVPKFAIRIPHSNQIFYNLPSSSERNADKKISIEIILLSKIDGRDTIVDLTKTMAELCKQGEMSEDDITQDLVDKELQQLVGQEPDLLLYFGPNLDLQGFPPWQLRLTELFWEHDNDDVSYTVFIRGLKKYSACKINVGK